MSRGKCGILRGMKLFYSYLWLREDGTPYYAGKGTGRRAFISFTHGVHCPPQPKNILVFVHSSESEAFESEKEFIKWFGRKDLGTGCLRNLTDGGEGASGCKKSLLTCQKLSNALKGRAVSDTHRRHLSDALKGKKNSLGCRHSAEEIRKNAERRRGQKRSAESKQKMQEAAKRRWAAQPMSEETKSKLRVASTGRDGPNRGKKASEETKQKMSAAHKRIGISPETRNKMKAKVGRGADGRLFSLCPIDPLPVHDAPAAMITFMA